ncbi:MAG: hypothetical protein MZV70_45535 [Desulfobacterales bacterium]|nr:hypothetical protein [Desulfobacterales bacterium]
MVDPRQRRPSAGPAPRRDPRARRRGARCGVVAARAWRPAGGALRRPRPTSAACARRGSDR